MMKDFAFYPLGIKIYYVCYEASFLFLEIAEVFQKLRTFVSLLIFFYSSLLNRSNMFSIILKNSVLNSEIFLSGGISVDPGGHYRAPVQFVLFKHWKHKIANLPGGRLLLSRGHSLPDYPLNSTLTVLKHLLIFLCIQHNTI